MVGGFNCPSGDLVGDGIFDESVGVVGTGLKRISRSSRNRIEVLPPEPATNNKREATEQHKLTELHISM